MPAPDPTVKELLERMVASRQLSAGDARALATQTERGDDEAVRSEEDVLRWLSVEYGLPFTTLNAIQPDKEVLSLFA
jgi:hypothetical protein